MSDGERIAEAFVAARRAARGLPRYPGAVPATLAEGYAIQDRAIALHGAPIAGWKVGRIPPPLDARHGVNRLAGPIFAERLAAAAPSLRMPVFADGFAAAEAEFLLRIGSLPEAPYGLTPHAAAAFIDAVHVGIEIASSPYPGINSDGPTVTVSDFGNNHGLVIGAEVPDWRSGDFLRWTVRLAINEAEVGSARAEDMLDGPFGAAAFLFGHAAERGIALRPGQWISSGAVTGVHPIRIGERATARFGEALEVGCTADAAPSGV